MPTGKSRAALVLDPGDDLQQEPHAVDEAAAEAVVSLVDVGAHELGDQVAVGAVQLDAVEPRLLHSPGPFGELLDQVVDLLDGHGADRLALGDLLRRRRPRGRPSRGCPTIWSLADIRSLRGQAAWRPGCWICTAHCAPCRCIASANSARPGIMRVLVDRDAGDGGPAGGSIRRRGPDDDEAAAALWRSARGR